MLDELRPILPRHPRDGRWIGTVAGAGLLAALLADEPTVVWCLDQLRPYGGYYIAGGSGSVRCDGSVSRVTGCLAAALGRTEDARRLLTAAIAMDERIGALPYRVLSEVALAGVHLAGGRASGGRWRGAPGCRHRPSPRHATRAGGRRGAVGPYPDRARHRPPADDQGA